MPPEPGFTTGSHLERLLNENVHHLIALAQIYRQFRNAVIDDATAEAQIEALCDTVSLFSGFSFSGSDREQLKKPIRTREGLEKPMALADRLFQMLVWKSISEPSPHASKAL